MRLRQINEVINKQEKEKKQRAILDHVVRMPAYFYFRHEEVPLVVTGESGIATTSPDKALVMNSLARLYETQAQFDLAEVILRKSLEINEAVDGKLSQNTSNTLSSLARI